MSTKLTYTEPRLVAEPGTFRFDEEAMKTLSEIASDEFQQEYDADEGYKLTYEDKWDRVAQAVRKAVIEECAKVANAEIIEEIDIQNDEDEAYNIGVLHAVNALYRLNEKPSGA